MIYIIKLHQIEDTSALVSSRPNWYEVDRFESDQHFEKRQILYVRHTGKSKCYIIDRIAHAIEYHRFPDGMKTKKAHEVTILYCYRSDEGIQDPDYPLEVEN